MQLLTFFVLLIISVSLGESQGWTRENVSISGISGNLFRHVSFISEAIRVGDNMYISGIHVENPGNMTFGDEANQVLNRIRRLVQAGRMALQHVAKTTVYLTDWNNYDEMNKVYLEYFHEKFPARSALQVVKLPAGARVLIEAVVVHSDV